MKPIFGMTGPWRGGAVESQLDDPRAPAPMAFHRVFQVPLTAPLDSDGDGLDDVWESRYRRPGVQP
jgi:hypothetical protein